MAMPRTLARALVRTAQRAWQLKSSAPSQSIRSYTTSSAYIQSTRPSAPRRDPRSPPRIGRSCPAIGASKFSTSPNRRHGHVGSPKPGEELWVTFVDKDGQEVKIACSKGDNLLDIAQANDLEMEGACGGSCACSTCHVIVQDEDYYDKMPEPDDDENDMLDLAFGLTETSRLGCQIHMTEELDGLVVKLPSMTRNLQASDFKS